MGATVVVGILFSAIADRVVEDYALRQQARTAALYVSEFLAPRLFPEDFLSAHPAIRVQFEFALRDLIGRGNILRVTVWNRQGRVLYSDDPAVAGRTLPLPPLLASALAGQIEFRLVRSPHAVASGPRRMEVFVPVVVSGAVRPVGVYNVLVDLKDLEPALIRLVWSVRAAVVLGIFVLYTGLFTIVRAASRDLERQHRALRQAFEGTVRSLANAVDARDMATADHSSRVAEYAVGLAGAMGLSDTTQHEAQAAGFLHDLGKIGIRDDILIKKGPLTNKEWATMRRHPSLGYEILAPVPIAESIKLAIRHSHESWDGRGYPDGLAGEQIPLVARIVAVADAFEALTTDRPYRTARSPEEAEAEIRRCAGTQFDPKVVDAFLRVWRQWADRVRARSASRYGTARAR